MKYVGWIAVLVLVAACIYFWNFQEVEYLPGEIVYDTVRVEKPIDKKLILKTEKTYVLSERRKQEVDSLRAVIGELELIRGDFEYEIEELEAIIEYIENDRDSITTALFRASNIEAKVVYKFRDNEFEIDYRKLFDVYARERIKGVRFGVSYYVLKQNDWGIELGGMIGFPKIIKRTYLGLKGSSLGTFGVGIHYIF